MTIHDPGNIILTSCEVKLKLDRQEICLIPQEIGGQITVSSRVIFCSLVCCAHREVRRSV